MIKLGLTGSMGMGKSVTAQMFRDAAIPVFDADEVVHRLYAAGGQGVDLIAAVFPDAIKDGAVDRKVLAAHMQADPLNLGVLESFIHPMVAQRRENFLNGARGAGADIVLFDVPLLFETDGLAYIDKVIVVTAPSEVQKQRILARPGMTEDLMETLLARQMPDAEKRRHADYIIPTDQGFDAARQQVESIIDSLRSEQSAADAAADPGVGS